MGFHITAFMIVAGEKNINEIKGIKMKKVTTFKRGLLNLLLSLMGLAVLIFLGWLAIRYGDRNLFKSSHRMFIKGMFMLIGGIVIIYSVIIGNIMAICSRNRVTDVPEYSKLLDGVFEDKKSKKLRRQMKSALLSFDGRRYKKAIRKLEPLIDQCTNGKEKCSVYTVLGMCRAGLRQHEKAVEAYDMAVKNNPSDPSLWKNLGQEQCEAGMYPQAAKSWLREIECGSTDARPYIDIANAFLCDKKYDQAVEYANKSIEISDNFCDAYKVLCLAYRAIGDKENCRSNYNLCRIHGGDLNSLSDVKVWIDENNQ